MRGWNEVKRGCGAHDCMGSRLVEVPLVNGFELDGRVKLRNCFAVLPPLADFRSRWAERADRGAKIIVVIYAMHRCMRTAASLSTIRSWARVVPGGMLLATDTACGVLVLAHGSGMTEFATVPTLGIGAEGEVFREEASAVADKQVLIAQGLQGVLVCDVQDH